MPPVGIEQLFDNERLPEGMALVPVLLYFPLGLCLALLRLFIGLHTFLIACLLPKASAARSVVLRTMCGVLGLFVSSSGLEHRDKKAKIMVTNYTSVLDHLAVDLVLPNIMPSVWDLPPALMWILGYTDMGAKKGRETLIQNAKTHCQESQIPLLVFPEGASTNGRFGLLKFSIWPFSLEQPVQPVVIQVCRPPFTRISPSILGGRWWIDIFWFLFVPYTCFNIRLLAAVDQAEDEAPEEYTQRTQSLMADALSIQATPHTSADKVEYAKRKLFVPPYTAPQSNHTEMPAEDDGTSIMIRQVREVLPHVPSQAIRTDLALTKDVDLTITNILEGKVAYTPVEPGVESSPPPAPRSSLTSRQDNIVTAKRFGITTNERHLSLDERKHNMMDQARRRYMEKHGLL